VPFTVVIPRHTVSELGFEMVAVFLTGAAEEIEGWLVISPPVEDVTKVAASVANPAECGVCRPLSGTPCVDLVTISGAVSRSR